MPAQAKQNLSMQWGGGHEVPPFAMHPLDMTASGRARVFSAVALSRPPSREGHTSKSICATQSVLDSFFFFLKKKDTNLNG